LIISHASVRKAVKFTTSGINRHSNPESRIPNFEVEIESIDYLRNLPRQVDLLIIARHLNYSLVLIRKQML